MTIIRNMTMADYLASPAISHSKLRDFSISPRLYHDKWVRNLYGGDEDENEETLSMSLGRAFEALLQDAACVERSNGAAIALRNPECDFVIKPEGLDGRTKEGKEWTRAAGDKTIISHKDFANLEYMARSVREHDCAMEMLAECEYQVTFTSLSPDEAGSRPLDARPAIQSRPDYFCAKGSAFSEFRPYTIDLKTTTSIDRFRSGRAIVQFGYHTQAEMVGMTMGANGFRRRDITHFLLAVEKKIPHRCELFEVSEEYLLVGNAWVLTQLIELERCATLNTWPRARPGIVRLEKPRWLKEEESA